MTFRSIILTLACAALAACATATPYGPKSALGYGYDETQIEANRFRVSYSGDSLTDLETVETSLLYRAAELTLQQGYDWFSIVDRDTDERTRYVSSGAYSPYYSGFGRRYYHPAYGWYPWYDPFWADDLRLREVTKFEASAEIMIGRGSKPANDPRAYDARQVEGNLRNKVFAPRS